MLLLMAGGIAEYTREGAMDERMLAYVVDSRKQDMRLYWENGSGEVLNGFRSLKDYVEGSGRALQFAMKNGRTWKGIDAADGEGNCYLKPGGVIRVSMDFEGLLAREGGSGMDGRFGVMIGVTEKKTP